MLGARNRRIIIMTSWVVYSDHILDAAHYYSKQFLCAHQRPHLVNPIHSDNYTSDTVMEALDKSVFLDDDHERRGDDDDEKVFDLNKERSSLGETAFSSAGLSNPALREVRLHFHLVNFLTNAS